VNNDNLVNINKEKSKKLKEKIIKNLSKCEGIISIIPLLGFNKWIIIIDLIKKESSGKIIDFEYLHPVEFREIKNVIIINKNIPFWLEFLVNADIINNLTNPLAIHDLLFTKFKTPEIVFNEINSFRQRTVMISCIDPLEDIEEFGKHLILPNLDLDELYIPEKEYDLEKDSIEIDGKNYQIINGYLFDYYPPQIFLFFQNRYDMHLRFIKGLPANEIIFEKKLQGKFFLLWRLNYLFIEFKFPGIDNLIQFINLFLFYIRLFDDSIYILEPIQKKKEKILVSEQNEILLASEMFTTYSLKTKEYDPKKYEFYKNYWYLDSLESIFHLKSMMYHSTMFDEAFNFSTQLYPNKNLRNYVIHFFESLCYFKKKELDHCLISLWNIIEKFIDQKWVDIVEESSDTELSEKLKKELRKRMYSHNIYTISSKIDLLFFLKFIDANQFTRLRNFNKCRNNLIHDFISPSKNLVIDLMEFILNLFKTDFIKILNPLIPNIEENLDLDSILPTIGW